MSHLLSEEEFPGRPWLEVQDSVLPNHPSMLGDDENRFLYWYARNIYAGNGEIFDLGAFLGGSATCLARGLEDAGHKNSPPIKSFDFFRYDPRFYPNIPILSSLNAGDSTVPTVKILAGDDSRRIDCIEGDICLTVEQIAQHHPRPCIDFVFLDFTQNWFHHDAIVKHVYPLMKKGCILAHQDYLYVLCYWLHIYMERWSDYFQPISRKVGGGTAAFRLVRELPLQATQDKLVDYLSREDMDNLFEQSLRRYPDEPHAGHLACAKIRLLFHTRRYEKARSLGESLVDLYAANDGIVGNINLALAECEQFQQQTHPPYAGYLPG